MMSRATVQVMRYANPDYHPQITSQLRVLKWWCYAAPGFYLTLAGWKMGPRMEDVLVFPIKNGGKDCLPTTIFQGLTVKLRRCTFWKEDLLKSYQVIEVFHNLTYESEMFLLSQLQLSKRLLQNNMAFAAVRCLNNDLKAKKTHH